MKNTMKAWFFENYGEPDLLTIKHVPIPTPGPGQVLIKITASAVNPSDVKNVSGVFNAPTPRIPGRDFAGNIVHTNGRTGVAVWGSGAGFGVTMEGAHAQFIIMENDTVSKKPPELPDEFAAAIGVPFLAAWEGLINRAKLKAGERVLITGANGAVGRAAIQIAKWKGATVIGAVKSKQMPTVPGHVTVVTTDKNWIESVKKLTNDQGVDIVFDVIGGDLFPDCLQTLTFKGKYIVIASNPPIVSFNMVDFYHQQNEIIGVDTMKLSGKEIKTIFDALASGFASGALSPPPIKRWNFEDAIDAYQAVKKGTEGIKQVIIF